MTDTVDKVIIQAETQGVQQSTDQLNQLGKSMDGVTVASSNVEKSTGSIDSKFAALGRRFQTEASNLAQFAKVQETVNAAVANNPMLKAEGDEIIAKATARYLTASSAVKELAQAHAGLSGQAQSVGHAFRSAFDSLAAGAPLTQVATQQFGHLSYAMSGQGGLSGAFSEWVSTLGRMISPTTIAIGAVGALAAGAAAAAIQYDHLAVSAQRAISGAGARTGTTISDINAFAAQTSSSSGLSGKEARALAEDLTATGEVVVSKLHGMGDAVLGFANQTQTSVESARKAFVGFAQDPQKALEELTKVFGPLDQNTRDSVQALSLAGDKTAALQLIVDKLSDKLKDAAGNMGFFEKAARGIGNFLATPVTQPKGLDEQVEAARAKLNAAIDRAPSLLSAGVPADTVSANVQRASQAFEQLFAAQQKVISVNVADHFNKISAEAEGIEKAIFPQIDAYRQLEAEISKLKEAQAAGAGDQYNSGAVAVAEHLKALQQDSLDTTIRQAQAANQLQAAYGGVSVQTALTLNNLKGQLTVAQQVTAAGQMRAQAEATYNNLVAQGVKSDQASLIADQQLAVSKAAATTQVLKQVEALKDQDAMIKAAQDGTEAQTAAAIAYKNAIQSGADAAAAAALSAQTYANAMDQAAASAQRAAEADIRAANAAMTGAVYNSQGALVGFQTPPNLNPPGTTRSNPANSEFAPSEFAGFQSSGELGNNRNYNEMLRLMAAQQSGSGVDSLAAQAYASGGVSAALAAIKAAANTTGVSPEEASIAALKGYDLNTIFGAQQSTVSNKMSAYDQYVQLANAQTSDKTVQAKNLQGEIDFLNTLPTSIARDQKIINLQQSIDALKTSTDNLNQTNKDALSPYYNQDPRTSHIGFRSQGMASTGYIDIPGVPSANDNATLTLPVASGERVNVTNGPDRGGGSKTQTVNITNHITIAGNATEDQVGRTGYQLAQMMAKQVMRVG